MISRFEGEYAFLSNFFAAEFVWDGIIWPTSEHAYQAAKTLDRAIQIDMSNVPSPGKIKRFGATIPLRPDWTEVKVSIMKEILVAKFKQNPDLKQKLLDTGLQELEEGNTWDDTFWGVCPPGSDQGFNMLGKLLMEVREELK